MTNRFKTNSRFANLIEETSSYSENKKKKTNEKPFAREETSGFKRNDYSGRNNRNRDNSREFEKLILEQEKKKKETEAQKNLAAENFPDLINNSKNNNKNNSKNNTSSYIEKAMVQKNETPTEINQIKPGWVEVKRDPSNPRKLIYTYGESTYKEDSEFITSDKSKLEPQVLDALVKLHNKRTQEYINMWGYETWEHLYRFPNYDYHYFDKLDEKYEEEMEENNLE